MSELSLQKRRSGAISGSERITGVKNAQADVLLSKKKQQYDFLMKKNEQKIILEAYKLQHDNKVLGLQHKTNELEYKKRLHPYADLSHEETELANLQKYLVQGASRLCYTDKSLSHKVRHRASTETVPPVVAEARMTMETKKVMKSVERSRRQMYDFLDKPKSRQDKMRQREEFTDEVDAFERMVQENQPLHPTEQTKGGNQKQENKNQQHLTLPMMPEQNRSPKTMAGSHKNEKKESVQLVVPNIYQNNNKNKNQTKEAKEIHNMMKQNPVLKEAIETHQKEKSDLEAVRTAQSVNRILSRMSKKQPPTKTQIQDEAESVQNQVDHFCKRIEEVLWTMKEEEFQQSLKFVKDKDAEWNRFMETMQKRNRTNTGEIDELSSLSTVEEPKRRPATSLIPKTPLTEKQKEQRLIRNLLINKPRQTESAPVRKRGIPYRAADRSKHHSATAKLKKILQQNKSVLEAVMKAGQNIERPEKGNSNLRVAAQQAEITAR